MYLKQLELLGFKSFAKKTTLDFPRGVTVIIGPNGVGKSNLVDAVRWAMAEQSLKTLRGKKGEDLIFHGSSDRSTLSRARVSLTLAKVGDVVPLDLDEVVIERVLTKSGESDYFLNGKKVRLMDLETFLSASGVGSGSFRVLSQGMSDMLITLGPQEFREFIEDAAGVREFQDKRHRSLLKLRATAENLEKVSALLAELAPRLRFLKREVSKLNRKERVERSLRETAQKLFSVRYHRIIKKENEFAQKKKAILARIASVERSAPPRVNLTEIINEGEELARYPQRLPGKFVHFWGRVKSLLEKLDGSRADYYDKLSELEREHNELKIEEEKTKLQKAGLEHDLRSIGVITLVEVLAEPPALKLDEEKAENDLWRLKRQAESVGAIDEAILQEHKGVNERYEFLSSEQGDLKEALASLENLIKGLDREIKELFNHTLSRMSKSFASYFRLMFDGGKAALINTRSKDDEEGIEIEIEIPKKRVKNLSMLSGGERTLVSIALLFALVSIRRPPFLVLDEIDAALDETNTERFMRLLKEISRKTQFIIITHNRATMRGADAIYGVSMKGGASQLLSIKLAEREMSLTR